MLSATRVFVFVSFLAQVEGHVKFFFSDNTADLEERPIRNAPGRTSDGVMSTDGPCGGNLAWGANGYSIAEEADKITMKINYNGGHKSAENEFRGVWACDDETEIGVSLPQSVLEKSNDPTEPQCKVLRCPEGQIRLDTATSTERCGAAIGNEFEEGYLFECTVPSGSAGRNCTMSVMDQRDWGGCYDLFIMQNPVVIPQTTSPNENIFGASIQGTYRLETDGQAIGNAPAGETCCELDPVTTFTVVATSNNQMKIMAEVGASCNGQSFVYVNDVFLTKDLLGPVWRATLVMGVTGQEQEYEISVSDGLLQITQLDPSAPQFCDFVIKKMQDNSVSRAGMSFVVLCATLSTLLLLF